MNVSHAIALFGVNLVAPLVVGQVMRGRAPLPRHVLDRVVNANVYVLVTLLGLLSLWVVKLEMSLLWMPVIACAVSAVAGLAGAWRARHRYDDPASQGSYAISAMISNRNTAGTIAAFLLLGEAGYANARMFVVPNWPFLFIVCYPVAAMYQRRAAQRRHAEAPTQEPATGPTARSRPALRMLLHPSVTPILGMGVGLLLNAGSVQRPAFVDVLVPWLIMVNMWLFLVPLGFEFDLAAMRRVRHDVVGLAMVKFIVTPLAGYVLGRLCGLTPVALSTCVILCCSPVAIQAVVTCRIFKLDHPLALGAFALTMLLFLILVVPAIMAVFNTLGLSVQGAPAAGASP